MSNNTHLIEFSKNQFEFADVLLPLALPGTYTYHIPEDMRHEIVLGQRVMVQFGKQKLYSALIHKLHNHRPEYEGIKSIIATLDEGPVIQPSQLEFWEWMSSYYMCSLGEIMKIALPAQLRLSSETQILLNENYVAENYELSDKEFLIVEALELQGKLSIDEICKVLGQKSVFTYIRALIEKDIIYLSEELQEGFRAKTRQVLVPGPCLATDEGINNTMNLLEKARKQQDALIVFLSKVAINKGQTNIEKAAFLKNEGVNSSAVNSLIKKGILLSETRIVGRISARGEKLVPPLALSPEQAASLEKIRLDFEEKHAVLLHGVTGSGKTEIYVHLIKENLDKGLSTLVLVPEIALTTQLVERLSKHFGKSLGVYHSRFNPNERVEIWNNVLADKADSPKVILGARSAVFLPFRKLGLIIIDEEYESSFKQIHPSPRYHARDAALMLAHMHGAKTLLGTATPSLESYQNALSGKYGLVKLEQRYGKSQQPKIVTADMKEAMRMKTMKACFTPQLYNLIAETLAAKEQVILFQNRRGFSTFFECGACAWIPQCRNCNVTLTYHKSGRQMRCHYCGYQLPVVTSCQACKSTNMQMKGLGTEQVEDDLGLLFPDARVGRLDVDSARGKNAYHQIISDFENQQIQILVGTQMVTKGLDFSNVRLVGVINAGSLLGFPDFRSFERGYQLMSQVSGRAGRRSTPGYVVIQTYDPSHPVLDYVKRNDYEAFYEWQIADRFQFHYPPFYRLIILSLRCRDEKLLAHAAHWMSEKLKQIPGMDVIGPQPPLVNRINNYFINDITLKMPKLSNDKPAKAFIILCISKLHEHKDYKSVLVGIDVDPQ
jgi:primosomal protein N' (replication factor Y) (superfamily II helicase)